MSTEQSERRGTRWQQTTEFLVVLIRAGMLEITRAESEAPTVRENAF